MDDSKIQWRPGSFTKNFSWGSEQGLRQIYDCIRVGFDNVVADVPRELFRERIESKYNFYIAANFFLFNIVTSQDFIIVDELVFQAVKGNHGPRFDRLALFAFNLSYAGRFRSSGYSHATHFRSSTPEQRRPAMWAHWYVRDRVAQQLNWNTQRVDADDIERFVKNDPRYSAKGTRKLATNLNHLYRIGRLEEMSSDKVHRWWVDALFLALDRIIADQLIDRIAVNDQEYGKLLQDSGFLAISGKPSLEKELATKHLLQLYRACGGRDRFSDEAVLERTRMTLTDVERWVSPNDADPSGAIHPSNPRIMKSIPPACAMLAMYVGFEVISSLAMEHFDLEAFVRERTTAALADLKMQGIRPTMTAEEVLRLTREK